MVALDPDPGADGEQSQSRYKPDTGFGAGLYDAANAFQALNRYLLLWTCGHLWNKASRIIFNRYQHHNLVYVRRVPGKAPIIIHSKGGIAQGCGMAMQVYGIVLLSLCISMNAVVLGALQPWYADDASSVGTAADNARCLAFLVENGPKYGYHPQP